MDSEGKNRKFYNTVVISDVHLGAVHSRVDEASDFLESVRCRRLILNGDIIDGWQLDKKQRRQWKQSYTRFFSVIMEMMSSIV